MHRSGFVNIIGKPNVGKSTLMNQLVGERMSIITNKPQTTRHRIFGILNGDDFQIVFSDTPGIIDMPAYQMQKAMNQFALSTFEDADIMMLVVDVTMHQEETPHLFKLLDQLEVPVFLVLNKIDLAEESKVKVIIDWWKERVNFDQIFAVSALEKHGTDTLMKALQDQLPEGPEYYPKDQLSDKPERFFVAEMIREKILELYYQEIPYSCEVVIETFKEKEGRNGKFIHIFANIYVGRRSQKNIIIGDKGSSIKKLGMEARKRIEDFLQEKVFLELYVKVRENWRDDEQWLKRFGYK